jgi:hypothetical protein
MVHGSPVVIGRFLRALLHYDNKTISFKSIVSVAEASFQNARHKNSN